MTKRSPIEIGVIANNDRTVSELLSYLANVGIKAQPRPDLCACSDGNEVLNLQAVVIFPDDFEDAIVDDLLDRLRLRQPALFQLIVTRQPQRFVASLEDGRPPRIVMPRPTFGWRIVDAIRAHLAGDFESGG